MRLRYAFAIIFLIILADQALKIWIKTSFPFGEVMRVFGSEVSAGEFRGFKLYFIENEGMAWGWKFGGEWGKMILTLFRLVAVIFGVYYIRGILKKDYHRGFMVCV